MILSGASSRGKTTIALSLAHSLLAKSEAAENFNATVNALNERCALYQGRCMVVDDLSNVSQGADAKSQNAQSKRLQMLADFIRRVATGQDKARHGDPKAISSIIGSIVSANDLPGNFGQSDPEQVNMLKARSIQFTFGANDQVLNLVGLKPEKATERIKAAADSNYGWIGLQFNKALCEHLNYDFDETTNLLLSDFDKFRSNAVSEFPNLSSVASRVVKQFALIYAALKFANRTNVLPASIWGTPDGPVFEAMSIALGNAGLDGIEKQSDEKSEVQFQQTWPQSRLEKKLLSLAKSKPDLFINSTVRPFPQVDDKRADKSLFIAKTRKDGHQIAIKKEAFLKKVLRGLGHKELRFMRSEGNLITAGNGSLTATKPLRQKPGKRGVQKPVKSERCYLIKISDTCVDKILSTLDSQGSN